jgi:CubicO group peptidase (beta-lactamase class C family)
MITRRTFQAGILLSAVSGPAATADALAGTWSGVLYGGPQRLRLKLDIAEDGSASFVSLDQDRVSFPGKVVSSASDRIEIEFPTLRAVFAGHIAAADSIDGVWRQNGANVPLTFDRGEAALAETPPVQPLTQAATAMLAGTWSGVLDAGSQRLRLKLDIAEDGTASLWSLDRRRESIPGRVASAAADRIEIEFYPTLPAMFAGHVAAPDRIEGVWRQNFADSPLTFERGEAALTSAPPPDLPLTQERLVQFRVQAGSPALAAAAVRRAAPLRIWVDGERAVATGIAVQEGDLWHLGSITKSMTATLVARLVDSGALGWGETVGEVLRTVAPEMNDAYREVTLRHLLSHRAGLPNDIPEAEFVKFSPRLADAREERKSFIRIALAMQPRGSMGQTFEYSNNGYVVAGAMLEAKLGRSWEDLIRAHLFEPLELSTAGFGPPGRRGATDQPLGHFMAPGGEMRQARPVSARLSDNPAVLGPAGRVHMSLQDLLHYLAAHRDRTAFLQPQSWTSLHTPPFGGDYAMGWMVRPNGILWHNGSNTLWYAEVMFDAAARIAAAAACNDGNMAKSTLAVGHALRGAAAAV